MTVCVCVCVVMVCAWQRMSQVYQVLAAQVQHGGATKIANLGAICVSFKMLRRSGRWVDFKSNARCKSWPSTDTDIDTLETV